MDEERGELYCSECGLVVEENIVKTWELDPEDFSRIGPSQTYRIHDRGLSTRAGCGVIEKEKMAVSYRQLRKVRRIESGSRRLRSTKERNLAYALAEIERMASALGVPKDVRETAAKLYHEVVKRGPTRGGGRSIEGLATAALYVACRLQRLPRTLDEMAEVSRVSQKEISRSYRFLSRELDLKLQPTSPIDFVPRFCSKLGLDGEVEAKAIEIIKEAQEKELTKELNPVEIAAAAIYIAAILCGKHKTQKEVSEVTGVTEVTIRNRYKELAEELGIDLVL